MVLSPRGGVTYSYNEQKNCLVIVFFEKSDDTDDIWNISGWFGKKLYELLEGDGDVNRFFQQKPFSENKKLAEIFYRLIGTLIENNIIFDKEGEEGAADWTPYKFFKKGKSLEFGKGQYTGSLTVKSFRDLIPSEQDLVVAWACDPGDGVMPAPGGASGCVPVP